MIFGASRPRRPRATQRSSRRTPDEIEREGDLPPKLVPSVRQLFSTAVALVHTRLTLAGLELEEEMQRLIHAAAYGFGALVLVFLALVVGTFTIVAAAPPEHRVLTMILVTLAYFAVAVFLLLRVRSIFKNRGPIFGATLAELEKDRETLSQMARAHELAEEAHDREMRNAHEDAYAAPARNARGAV